MPEFDLQAARMLWAPPIRPQGGLISQIFDQRMVDWMDGWRYGLLQQEASVSTSGSFILMDIDEAALTGAARFGAVVTHILGNKRGSTASTATIAFGTNSATFNDWHTGFDISPFGNNDWFIIYPYPDSDGYGSDTPAGAVRKVRTVDVSNDEFRVINTGGTWGSSIDFYLFGFYWRELET